MLLPQVFHAARANDRAGQVTLFEVISRLAKSRVPFDQRHNAEDIASKVFLKILDARTNMVFVTDNDVIGYVVVALKNAAADFRRAEARAADISAQLLDAPEPEQDSAVDSAADGREEALAAFQAFVAWFFADVAPAIAARPPWRDESIETMQTLHAIALEQTSLDAIATREGAVEQPAIRVVKERWYKRSQRALERIWTWRQKMQPADIPFDLAIVDGWLKRLPLSRDQERSAA